MMIRNIAIVLAAGKGIRMNSDLPKVLIEVCRRPMIEYLLDALAEGGVERTVVVVGYRGELVRSALDGRYNVEFALQTEQLGTGHAVMACCELLADYDGPVLVMTGDSPLAQPESIATLFEEFDRRPAACIIGTVQKKNPTGLGRILRDAQGNFIGIVEEKDATDGQLQITEVNRSYYVFNCRDLLEVLDHVRADNVLREYYLTDAPGLMVTQGRQVRALQVLRPCESLGVNTLEELAAAEAAMKWNEK